MPAPEQIHFLHRLFAAALERAKPDRCLAQALPAPPKGRLIALSAGGAAAAMAQAAEMHYLERGEAGALEGIAAPRYGPDVPTRILQQIEAGHPIADGNSLTVATRALELARSAGADDLVLVLLSGGASALWAKPIAGVKLEEKQAIARQLLARGASADELDCVRRHLSQIKGGRLAQIAHPARLVTLAISDLAGGDPAVIGSGPTVGDPSTLEEASAILKTFHIPVGPCVTAALANPENETPFPGDPIFAKSDYKIVAQPMDALASAGSLAKTEGYEPVLLGDNFEGDARALARQHGELARRWKSNGASKVLLSGGKASVTVQGSGRGGPNQEFVLALALELDGEPGIWALAADTDGNDGGIGVASDPAGAVIGPDTLARARAAGLDPQLFLENNDSTGFFAALGDLLNTGPTLTNVKDFRAILVEA